MIKQNKGKDLHKVPKSKLVDGEYFASIKRDGWYCQIKYDGAREVRMWTSGGKEFLLQDMADYIVQDMVNIPFHIECEYNHDCDGFLGDRGKSAKLTTYFTEFEKGITRWGDSREDTFRVLDILDRDEDFEYRVQYLKFLFFDAKKWFLVEEQHLCGDLITAKNMAKQWYLQGYEGAMFKKADHIQKPGKRVNDIIKYKPRLTADLLCVGWTPGTGKYVGMIGSLLLKDSMGREVNAGSGLDDSARSVDPSYYIDKVIEIEYERIDDTYIQPIIKYIRTDKKADQID